MNLFGKRSTFLIVLGFLCAAGVTAAVLLDHHNQPVLTNAARASNEALEQVQEPDQERGTENTLTTVRTVHAHRDPSFTSSIEQPAFVEAYYQADLMARLAGEVKWIVHAIGDPVRANEELLKIDVPDLEADVQQKESVIRQRQSELELCRKNLKMTAAAADAASALVTVRQNEVLIAKSTQTFREKELRRFQGLASGPHPGVTQDILDERTEFAESAVAATATAQAAVEKAKADLAEARAKLEAAQADIQLKESLVDVARKEKDKAQAQLGFATIRAPFDGFVTRRKVDPGSFVQNATTHPDGLLTIARTDLVTVYMKVPDTYAPLVRPDSEAIIQMSSLPGMVIHARVTRFSPSLETPEHDRTMRVEVDLFNGPTANYPAFLLKEKATGNADLKGHVLPVLPQVSSAHSSKAPLGLLPGQYGTMRLILRSFRDSFFLPSTAVFSQGGTSYVFLVKEGHVVRTHVEVEADNGKTLRLTLIEKNGDSEIRKELKGNEEIVFSNQGELSDGQPIQPNLVAW
jgi:multidrug resistance efflux pump